VYEALNAYTQRSLKSSTRARTHTHAHTHTHTQEWEIEMRRLQDAGEKTSVRGLKVLVYEALSY
jgi:predicted metal-dependent phosphotriesterase family hydrolase